MVKALPSLPGGLDEDGEVLLHGRLPLEITEAAGSHVLFVRVFFLTVCT
jgi:hypothetical protein